MIDYIRGSVETLTPTEAIVEAAGVGYQLYISLYTYEAVRGKAETKLFAYEVIREDTHQLFGFATRQEREFFVLLISVSGVGPQTARMMLSAFSPEELAASIQAEDARMLKSVKGVGPKAAQRIIVELRDKVAALQGSSGNTAGVAAAQAEAAKEASSALTTLGFAPAQVQKVVAAILKDKPGASPEMVIKLALKML